MVTTHLNDSLAFYEVVEYSKHVSGTRTNEYLSKLIAYCAGVNQCFSQANSIHNGIFIF